MESDAGEIPQAAAEAKNDKRYEGRIAVGIGRFTLETHQIGFIDSSHVWAILVMDKFNTCCEALLSVFCNNYLRHGLKN